MFHKSEDKMYNKMKMTQQRAKNLVYVQLHDVVTFFKNNFPILIFIADMAI